MKPSKPKLKRVRPLLGTYVEIELRSDAPIPKLHSWITAGFEVIKDIDRLMSVYRPDSDVSRLNRAKPGVWIDVNRHTAKVLRASNQFYLASEGNFDIRCGGALPHLNPLPMGEGGGIRVRGNSQAQKTGPWILDLGGIAKGYAVDCAVEKIKNLSRGYDVLGVVNAGGDLRRWGKGAPPVAVATSAVRMANNRQRLSPAIHVRMPEGQILTHQKAVTVFADRCLWSDALTKIMMLAPQRVADACLQRYEATGLVLA